jgi:hypothetical protein
MERISTLSQLLLAQCLAVQTLARAMDVGPKQVADRAAACAKAIELFVFVMPGTAQFYAPVLAPLRLLARRQLASPGLSKALQPFDPSRPLRHLVKACAGEDGGQCGPPRTYTCRDVGGLTCLCAAVQTTQETALLLGRYVLLELAELRTFRDADACAEALDDAEALLKVVLSIEARVKGDAALLRDAALQAQYELMDANADGTYSDEYIQLSVNARANRCAVQLLRMAEDCLADTINEYELAAATDRAVRRGRISALQRHMTELTARAPMPLPCEDADADPK